MTYFFGQEFEIDKIYKTELPKDEKGLMPGPLAIAQITKLLDNYHRTESLSPRWGWANRDFFPEGWDWVWLSSSKVVISDPAFDKPVELQGTLPKRIAAFYYKVYKRQIPAHVITAIGNAVKLDDIETRIAHWDITKSFNWRDGNYGDSGSCFWTTNDRSGARDYIRDHGGYAIRFYSNDTEDNPKTHKNGFARAFIIPHRLRDGTETWVVTNGYGQSTQATARFFAHSVGQSYRIIELTVDGQWDGPVYINAHGKGYLVGSQNVLANIAAVDFKWKAAYNHSSSYSSDHDSGTYCGECDTPTEQYELHFADGGQYCDNCYWRIYNICGHCHAEVQDTTMRYARGIDMQICAECARRYYRPSDWDGEMYLSIELVVISTVSPVTGEVTPVSITSAQRDEHFVQLDWPVYDTAHFARRTDTITQGPHNTVMLTSRDEIVNEPHDLSYFEPPSFTPYTYIAQPGDDGYTLNFEWGSAGPEPAAPVRRTEEEIRGINDIIFANYVPQQYFSPPATVRSEEEEQAEFERTVNEALDEAAVRSIAEEFARLDPVYRPTTFLTARLDSIRDHLVDFSIISDDEYESEE